MRFFFSLSFLCFIGWHCASQNLVPNPGFESFTVCPGSYSHGGEQIPIPGWHSVSAGTPDHYHTCSKGDADVPYNWAGVSDAYEGTGYAGLYLWMKDTDYREYIECKLTEPLVRDSLYHIEFFYKLSSYSKYSIDRIGFLCSERPTHIAHDGPLELKPTHAVIQDSALTKQTGLWERAYLAYRARGGEEFLLIGNFSTVQETRSYEIRSRPVSEVMLARAAYYYIDAVSVVPDFAIRKRHALIPEVEYGNLEERKNYVLKNIHFAFDSYRLLSPSFQELDKLAIYLLKYSSIRIQLFGHTDDRGGDSYNLRLSQARAKNVGDYLISLGIDINRIETFGYGKSKPLILEQTDDARKVNRRVEIRFLR